MAHGGGGDARQARRRRAEEALAAVDDHAADSTVAAVAVCAEAEAEGDPASAAVAWHAIGILRRNVGDLDSAHDALDRALAAAVDADEAEVEVRVRTSLVGLHLQRGRLEAARAAALAAAEVATGIEAARLAAQLALIEERAGRYVEALAQYDRAEAVLDAAGDGHGLGRVRLNRGVVLAELGRLDEAERDTRRAGEVFLDGDAPAGATVVLNLAWIAALRADVPLALARYDDAATRAKAVGLPVGLVWRDRAALLGLVGLLDEAVVVARAAVADLDRTSPVDAAEARLVLAGALATSGAVVAATAAATEAVDAFHAQDRPVWAARTIVVAGAAGGSSVEALLAAADELTAAGLEADALEARVAAVRGAARAGVPPPPGVLPLVPPAGPPWVRAAAWLAEAERRHGDGDLGGASSAVAAGRRVLDDLRGGLGSVELRAGIGRTGKELADLDVRLAVIRGGGDRLLAAAERRYGPPHRPSATGDDPAFDIALAALRAAAARAATAGDGAHAAPALRALAEAEARVRAGARRAGGAAPGRAQRGGLDELDDRLLVRYVVDGADLWGIIVSDGRRQRHHLGALTAASASIDGLRAGLRRMAAGGEAARRSAVMTARHAVAVDTALLGPLRAHLADRPVVVVPDGVVHAVPWRALPSVGDRPLVVAPSVAAWTSAHRAGLGACGPETAAFAAGPGLPGAEAEVAAAAEAWQAVTGSSPRRLDATRATVGGIRSAMEVVDYLHLACHGRLRADNPVFSSLALADGPLTGFDIDQLRRAPPIVVLGACDVGRGIDLGGGEIVGLVARLLAAGARSVVAAVVPLPDGAVIDVLARLAGEIARGAGPAAALASVGRDDPAAGGLICFGAG